MGLRSVLGYSKMQASRISIANILRIIISLNSMEIITIMKIMKNWEKRLISAIHRVKARRFSRLLSSKITQIYWNKDLFHQIMKQNNIDFSILPKEAIKSLIALYKKHKRPHRKTAKNNSQKPNMFITSKTPKTPVKTAT